MKIKYLIIVFLVLFLSISFVSAEDVEMNELTTTITVASCLKTDNSNPEVKGMLRFYPLYIQEYIDKNLQIPANSLVYKSDACISKNGETTTDLLEYSCFLDETNGKHKISADVIDCKSLGFNACENGACVIIEPEYSCLDTDFIEVNDLPETDDKFEHINFGVKGTTTKQNLNTGETWIVPEACSGNILFETYCNLENQDIEVTSYLCPEGTACSEGACIPQEPVVTTPSCSDTDFIENNDLPNTENYEFINFGLAGIASGTDKLTGEDTSVMDMCAGNLLLESYCDTTDGTVQLSLYPCPEGSFCNAGACVPEVIPEPECSDSDEGGFPGYSIFGEVSIAQGEETTVSTDYCEGEVINENHCNGNDLYQDELYCPSLGLICQEGACVEDPSANIECVDSDDGIEYESFGTVSVTTTEGIEEDEDFCNFNVLTEQYCDQSIKQSENINCDDLGLVCQNGQCAEELACDGIQLQNNLGSSGGGASGYPWTGNQYTSKTIELTSTTATFEITKWSMDEESKKIEPPEYVVVTGPLKVGEVFVLPDGAKVKNLKIAENEYGVHVIECISDLDTCSGEPIGYDYYCEQPTCNEGGFTGNTKCQPNSAGYNFFYHEYYDDACVPTYASYMSAPSIDQCEVYQGVFEQGEDFFLTHQKTECQEEIGCCVENVINECQGDTLHKKMDNKCTGEVEDYYLDCSSFQDQLGHNKICSSFTDSKGKLEFACEDNCELSDEPVYVCNQIFNNDPNYLYYKESCGFNGHTGNKWSPFSMDWSGYITSETCPEGETCYNPEGLCA